jgi:ABC-2 type transport system permease protein
MAKAESEGFSNLKQIGIVTKYELLKHLRRKRIYAVLAIAALIGLLQIAMPLAFNLGFPQIAKDWAWGFFSFTNFLIIIVGTFFAGDAIASEFELKTGYIVFPNPIKRVSLVFGKFVAALVSALLTIGFYYAIGTGASLGIYGVVSLEVAASFAYAFLYLCCVLGFTFLFSAVLKGSMGATLLSFFTFLLILSVMSQLVALTGNEPWFMPTYASGSIIQVIKRQQDSVIEIPGTTLKIYTFYPKDLVSAIILAAYFIATFALSMVVARRKEMA